jgi:uncharacterized membrane protein
MQLEEVAVFCTGCGTPVEQSAGAAPPPQQQYAPPPQQQYAPPPQQQYAPPPQQQYAPPPQQQYAPPPQQQYAPPPQQQYAGPQTDEQANKGMAILGFLIFPITLLTGDYKKSPFVKFFTNQGILYWILCFAVSIICAIVRAIVFATLFGGFNWLLYGTFGAAWGLSILFSWIPVIFWIVFGLLGLFNAVKGEWKELPLVGKFRILK